MDSGRIVSALISKIMFYAPMYPPSSRNQEKFVASLAHAVEISVGRNVNANPNESEHFGNDLMFGGDLDEIVDREMSVTSYLLMTQ